MSPTGVSSWPRSNRRNNLRAGGGRSEVWDRHFGQFVFAVQRTKKNQIRGGVELTRLEVGAGARSPGT